MQILACEASDCRGEGEFANPEGEGEQIGHDHVGGWRVVFGLKRREIDKYDLHDVL